MKNLYRELRERQQAEFDEFANKYMFFAFNDKQFIDGMKKLNLNAEADTNKIYRTYAGGFILKEKAEDMHQLTKRHKEELLEQIRADESGKGFIYDMFLYELCNHEYCITLDIEDTLEALGLTYEQISESQALQNGLELAKEEALKDR